MPTGQTKPARRHLRLYFVWRAHPGRPYRTYACTRHVLPGKGAAGLLWVGEEYGRGLAVQVRQNAYERKGRRALAAYRKRYPGRPVPVQRELFAE